MQKVVWSELAIGGPKRFEGELPEPEKVKDYYREIAVLAFPTPGDDAYRIKDIAFKAGFETASIPYDTPFGYPPLPIAFPTLPPESQIEQETDSRFDGRLQERPSGVECARRSMDGAAFRLHDHGCG